MSDIEQKMPADHVDSVDNVNNNDYATKVDTLHNDEAVKVIAAYQGDQTWTDMEEKNLRKKIDWKIMPILCLTYGLQYYDKAMLGQAVCSHLWTRSGNNGINKAKSRHYLVCDKI